MWPPIHVAKCAAHSMDGRRTAKVQPDECRGYDSEPEIKASIIRTCAERRRTCGPMVPVSTRLIARSLGLDIVTVPERVVARPWRGAVLLPKSHFIAVPECQHGWVTRAAVAHEIGHFALGTMHGFDTGNEESTRALAAELLVPWNDLVRRRLRAGWPPTVRPGDDLIEILAGTYRVTSDLVVAVLERRGLIDARE